MHFLGQTTKKQEKGRPLLLPLDTLEGAEAGEKKEKKG